MVKTFIKRRSKHSYRNGHTAQVKRGPTLIADTLDQIQKHAARDELKKPLKVQFVGEEGIDEGGVQKVWPLFFSTCQLQRGCCMCCLPMFAYYVCW